MGHSRQRPETRNFEFIWIISEQIGSYINKSNSLFSTLAVNDDIDDDDNEDNFVYTQERRSFKSAQ